MIKDKFCELVDTKYRKGQAQHGGNLWTKEMATQILDEAIDLFTYAITLNAQLGFPKKKEE